MSAIVKVRNRFVMFSKGADSIIKERLHESFNTSGSRQLQSTDRFLERASRLGFRTLLVAYRVLNDEEVSKFVAQVADAEADITERNDRLDQVYDTWEREL